MADNINLEKLFREAKGQPVQLDKKTLIRLDRFQMPAKELVFNFSFLETNSEWKQGFLLKTKGTFQIKGFSKINNAIVFWEDTAPSNIELSVDSKDEILLIYNVWDLGDGVTQAWHNGAAMEVIQDSKNKRIYYCNDGHPDLDFNDLIFTMSWKK